MDIQSVLFWIYLLMVHLFLLIKGKKAVNLSELYSLCQKKLTFNSDFFCDPTREGGPKIHMVDYESYMICTDPYGNPY